MKNILLSIVVLCVTLSFTTEKGTRAGDNGSLLGAVTYKVSTESSLLPDAGCEIYIINETDVKSTKYADIADKIGLFQRNKTFCSYTIYNTIDADKIKKARENFASLSDYVWENIRGFQKLPAMVRAKTNSSGDYSLSLKPGRYYILYVSGNLKSNNIAESKGIIDYKVVDIKPARETIQNINFDKHENLMLLQVIAIAGEGC